MSVTRERPILFSGAMVRAILDGRKTQTRRPLRPQPKLTREQAIAQYGAGGHFALEVGFDGVKCPYGTPGDRLWVRETWCTLDKRGPVVYRADTTHGERVRVDAPWRPSIYMPRSASRVTLELTDVRVERLLDISEADACAEGVAADSLGWSLVRRENFRELWDRLNDARGFGWKTNPWVWALTFRRVEGQSAAAGT